MNKSPFQISRYDHTDLLTKAADFLILQHYGELYTAMSDTSLQTWVTITVEYAEITSSIRNIERPINPKFTGLFLHSCTALFAKSHLLGNLLLSQSRETMDLFNEAVMAAQIDLCQRLNDPSLRPHPRIVLRWSHIPPFPEVHRSTIPKSNDANRLLMVRGTVVRAAAPHMIEWEVVYQCQTCHGQFTRHADLESFNHHPYPTACGTSPINGKKCTSKKFAKVSSVAAHNTRDYQELKLQEQVQHLDMGSMPRSIAVVIMDNLVGLCNAGDDVTVTGLLARRWGELSFGVKPEVELVLIATNIALNSERKSTSSDSSKRDEVSKEFAQFWQDNLDCPYLARNAILRSICPDIYGMYHVKLALAMVLAGGVRVTSETSTTRGDSHILMIGDPGTGKSQLLRFAAKMANRSVMTTGVGTTGAGLTAAAAVDQRGDWGLEAGALVLADGGACCIDEFASIRKDDQTSIHEAMEQQTIHMAKAGIVCELHTRCSIIAATNPKSKYNIDESVAVNVALGTPLLSRFDVVLVLLDEPDEQWDRSVSSFILAERSRSSLPNDADDAEEDAATGELDTEDALVTMFQNGAFDESAARNKSSMRSGADRDTLDQHFGAPTSPAPNSHHRQRQAGGSPSSIGNMDSQSNGGGDIGRAGSASASSHILGLEQSAIFSRSNGVRGGSLLHDVWPIEKLQSYFHWIKSSFKPRLSAEVTLIGQRYYARQRQADTPDAARTTARLADSIVRLTQGHAKLMARHVATVPDIIFAIVLLESSTFTSSIGGQRFPTVRSFFSADPDADYPQLEAMILDYLDLKELSTTNTSNTTNERASGSNGSGAGGSNGPRPFSGYNASQPNYIRPAQRQPQSIPQTPTTPVSTRAFVDDEAPPRPAPSIPLVFDEDASQLSLWGAKPQASQHSQFAPSRNDTPPATPSQFEQSQTTSFNFGGTQAPLHSSTQQSTAHSQHSKSSILYPASETADLIPPPPGSDADLGVWATETPALQFSHDDPVLHHSSQMDTDEDFMM